MNCIRALLHRVFDYAGLFPPAHWKMTEAIEKFAGYLAGPDEWALGRFIVPIARLPEFEQALRGLPAESLFGGGWRISVLGGPDLRNEIRAVMDFNVSWPGGNGRRPPRIDTIELRISTVREIEQAAELIPPGLRVCFEMLVHTDPRALVEAAGRMGACAKVRTGGFYAEMIPSSEDLVRFMECCRDCRVPFKAAGGLHNPLRRAHPPAANNASTAAPLHGFLNLLLGATLCRLGVEHEALVALLEEEEGRAFLFGDEDVSWRGHRATLPQLREARERLMMSFSACWFAEPMASLRALLSGKDGGGPAPVQ